MMLSDAQITSFRQDGYLVVPDVIPSRVIEGVRAEYGMLIDALYDDWFAQGRVTVPPKGLGFWDKMRVSYAAGCDWFQPMDISLPGGAITADTPMHFGPAIFDLVVHDRLLDLIEQLIGPEITSNPIQHVRIKPPTPELSDTEDRPHVTKTDWHQDRAVGHAEADQTDMITAWIAITDATVENGCLQVAPGIAQGMLPHCPQVQTAIAPAYLDAARARPVPVPSGGVVLFHPLVPHGSLPNMSDGFRWSFDLRFHVTGQHSGRAHFPSFVARSKANPATELRDWQVWQSLWLDARARLCDTAHIPIHRWASDAPYCA